VRQGYRAGGRAPIGYRLNRLETGAIRDGQPVTKSQLVPTEQAHQVARYLKLRAAGHSRAYAKSESGLTLVDTTLIGIEWNALTYAGHTVWNVRNEFHRGGILQHTKKGGYKGKTKRRPRSEWVINHDTHDALITTEEAETLLAQLEDSPMAKARRTPATYLLTGVLKTPANDSWYGDSRRFYRTKPSKGGKHRRVDLISLENAVVNQLVQDLNSTAFVKRLMEEARKQTNDAQSDRAQPLRVEADNLSTQISRAMDIALQMSDPAPALRKVEEIEARRKSVLEEISRQEAETNSSTSLASITEAEVSRILKDTTQNIKKMGREALKDSLMGLVDRINLDPDTLDCAIHYRIAVGCGNKVASPRGVEPLSPP
jgi:site-specific DNA recombinase